MTFREVKAHAIFYLLELEKRGTISRMDGYQGVLNAIAGDDFVRTGFQAQKRATLRDFEHTDAYLTAEQIRQQVRGETALRG